jgi:N6-adenosine-specific RNA methylase IME4
VQTIERSDEHSEKPIEFREIIDSMYTYGNKVELFARGELPEDWTGWGNELCSD